MKPASDPNTSLQMCGLTIIIPFFDETAFLRDAIRSIQSQRLQTVEILVVNDNPETFSHNDLATLTDGLPVTVLHHSKNRGLSAARNTGLAQARGHHIGFLDADDYYTSGGLRDHLAYAQKTGADITHAPCYRGHPGTPEGTVLQRDALLHPTRRSGKGMLRMEEAQFIVSSWSSLYRRDFLNDFDLRFDEDQPKFEDRLFVLHTVSAARTIAFYGHPTRVWRSRAGSISVAKTTPDIHILQVQLLEKCLGHIRDLVARGVLPNRFGKRELFNTVSRLIWDMDILAPLATDPSPVYADLAARISALLGDESFGHLVFDDPMVARISRVGMRTRKGKITRADFFALHKAMREGDFAAAHALMQSRAPTVIAPATGRYRTKTRLILHLGLHKTGSTYLQHHLVTHRAALLAQGILVPETGLTPLGNDDLRDGGFAGHQGLLQAHRAQNGAVWDALWTEIRKHKAKTVVISCENMLLPTDADRDRLIDTLMARLSLFQSVQVVALARDPATLAESFYREWVSQGMRAGARSIDEFLVDHQDSLLDFPSLFAPFERHTDAPAILGDFDALARENRLWHGFCALAGLPTDLPALSAPTYPSPDRQTIAVLRVLNMLEPDMAKRRDILQSFFTLHPAPTDRSSMLSPARRAHLVDLWQDRSASFAALRGFSPDLAAARAALKAEHWTPLDALPAALMTDLLLCAAMVAPKDPQSGQGAPLPAPAAAHPPKGREFAITIRPRPWVARILRRIF